MYAPILEQLSVELKSSMYKLNSIGEIIPPWLTPFLPQKNGSDVERFCSLFLNNIAKFS